jgi:hypothetical protein
MSDRREEVEVKPESSLRFFDFGGGEISVGSSLGTRLALHFTATTTKPEYILQRNLIKEYIKHSLS